MRLLLTTVLAAVVLLATAIAPGTAWATVNVGSIGQRVNGSGNVVEQPRTVGSFAALRVTGPIDVVLRASDKEGVSVRFDDNLQSMVETRVTEGKTPTLEIRIARDAAFSARKAPVVTVEFRQLEALSMSGSGDLRADRIRGEQFAVSIAGSSDVRIDEMDINTLGVSIAGSGDFHASGRADMQGIRIAGSGDVRAGKLLGKTVKISIAGSGDAQVHAAEALEVSIAGSGDVSYAGTPKVTQKIAGSGAVRAMQ